MKRTKMRSIKGIICVALSIVLVFSFSIDSKAGAQDIMQYIAVLDSLAGDANHPMLAREATTAEIPAEAQAMMMIIADAAFSSYADDYLKYPARTQINTLQISCFSQTLAYGDMNQYYTALEAEYIKCGYLTQKEWAAINFVVVCDYYTPNSKGSMVNETAVLLVSYNPATDIVETYAADPNDAVDPTDVIGLYSIMFSGQPLVRVY